MNLRNEWFQSELKKSEESIPHRPLEEEYTFYQAVSSGDMAFVQKNCRENTFTNPEGMGILSANPLTNIKYHFVVTVAMITRRCVEAGMELEQAFRLSDFYILKMDSYSSIEDISKLHKQMVLDYTRKMLLVKKAMPCQNPLFSVWIIYTVTSITESRWKNSQSMQTSPPVISPGFLRKSLIFPSVITFAK